MSALIFAEVSSILYITLMTLCNVTESAMSFFLLGLGW